MTTTTTTSSTTDWATAFTKAFHHAAANPTALAEGRRLVDDRAVGPLDTTQGRATTTIALRDGTVLRPRVTVAVRTEEQADRVDAALIPEPHEITFDCPCTPEGDAVCPHTAAVGHLLADHARTAPDILLTLRGHADTRPTTSVLDTLTDQPPAPVPVLTRLRVLTQDAAQRATALLNGDDEPCLNQLDDVVRFTAEHGQAHMEAAAAYLNLNTLQMRHLAKAYQYGGRHAVPAYLSSLPADPEALAHAEAAIQPLRPSPLAPLERADNRITDPPARVQLRHGPDRRWYPYTDRFGTWQPAPGPDHDPTTAYKSARAALRHRTL